MQKVLEQGTELALGLPEDQISGPQKASTTGFWSQPSPGRLIHELKRFFPQIARLAVLPAAVWQS